MLSLFVMNDKKRFLKMNIKLMHRIIIPIVLFISLTFSTGCNKEEPKFSTSQIQNALFEMKGTYHGEMDVSYYHGERISEEIECKFVSKNSLTIAMDLVPMASTIADENIASRLQEIGTVEVKAGYDFYQMDNQIYNFVLRPEDVIFSGENDETIRIVFAQNFGGDADNYYHSMMFNLSPKELWIGDKKYEPFRQLVYHYAGTYE